MAFNAFYALYFFALALVFLYSGDWCMTAAFGLVGFVALKLWLLQNRVESRSDSEIVENSLRNVRRKR